MFETDAEALVHEEEQALIPASSGVRGRGVRASSLLCASVLLVTGAGAVWWRGDQRISMRGVIGRSDGESASGTENEAADATSEEAESPCAADGQSCLESKCCASEGSTCYQKNKHWASCNQTCNNNFMWDNGAWVDKGEHIWKCAVLSENEVAAEASEEISGEIACATDGQNCWSSACCVTEGSSCYRKNEQ